MRKRDDIERSETTTARADLRGSDKQLINSERLIPGAFDWLAAGKIKSFDGEKTMKRATVRWYAVYADTPPKYMGWTYWNKVTYLEARNWLRSGNYIKFKNETLTQFTSASKLLNLFPR